MFRARCFATAMEIRGKFGASKPLAEWRHMSDLTFYTNPQSRGRLAHWMMEEIGELYSNDVQYELKTLSQQIEPILIVFLGVLVLVLALGVFLPLWDLGRVTLKK